MDTAQGSAPDADWAAVRAAFERALDLPPAEREAYLAAACPDPALRARVDGMLLRDAAHSREAPFERQLAVRAVEDAAASAWGAGTRVDGFTIRRKIGEGGMGSVFEAEQDRPRRSVALKISHGAGLSAASRRRFDAEVEFLGRLRHPGIAQIHGAGLWRDPATGRELPYFAMEFVPGARTLDRYVAERRPSERNVVQLFLQVCDAVHHGHCLGVVHRDLKPGNILVDGEGRTKVIDFGIARHTEPLDATALTASGEIVGTLKYMSPEQLQPGAVLDTRSDVYSLGVILFELLAGRAPLDPTGQSIAAFARSVADVDPPRPSSLQPALATDLDWIVLRALQKNPAERYPAVSELAADLRRYLRHEPVVAGPPSTFYLLRKYVRRHRGLVASAALLLIAIVTGAVVSGIGWMRANSAERLARREAETQLAVMRYWTTAIEAARLERAGRDVRVLDMVAAAKPDPLLETERPELARALHNAVAATYLSLAMPEQALSELGDPPVVPDELDAAALEVLHNYGQALGMLDRHQEALDALQRAFEARREAYGEDSPQVASTRRTLAMALRDLGRFDEAAAELDAAAVVFAAHDGEDSRETLITSSLRLNLSAERGELERAAALGRDLLARTTRAFGEDDLQTVHARDSLARVLRDAGQAEEARLLFERSLVDRRRLYGDGSPQVAETLSNLAVICLDQGRLAEAERGFRELVALEEALAGASVNGLIFRNNLAAVLERQDKLDEAEREFEQLDARLPGPLSADHWLLGVFDKCHAVCLRKRGDFAAAEQRLLRGIALMEAKLGADNWRVQKAMSEAVILYGAWGQPERATPWRARLTADKSGH